MTPKEWALIIPSLAAFLTAAGQWFTSHKKGKQGATMQHKTLERIESKLDTHITEVRNTVAVLQADIVEVRAIVVGPDGENGLRGTLNELRDDVKHIDAEVRRLELEMVSGQQLPPSVGSFRPPHPRPV